MVVHLHATTYQYARNNTNEKDTFTALCLHYKGAHQTHAQSTNKLCSLASVAMTSSACLTSSTLLHSLSQSLLSTLAQPWRPFISRAAASRSPSSSKTSVRASTASTSPPTASPLFLNRTLDMASEARWDATPASSGRSAALRTSEATRRKRSISRAELGMPRW